MSENKNDTLLEINSFQDTMKLADFKYVDSFRKIGVVHPLIDREKLGIEYINEEFNKMDGLVYFFVLDGVLLKVGSTITSMTKRVQSYNCGKSTYRKKGTCSTTNYFVLQNFLYWNKEIDVFAYFPEKVEHTLIDGSVVLVTAAKQNEKVILRHLKNEYGVLPVLCTQK